MKRIILTWFPFAIFLFLIYFFSTLSRPIPGAVSIDFSILHVIEFFILAFLLLRIFYAYDLKNRFLLTITVVIILGVIDEIIQSFAPGRVNSLMDVLLDAIGASFVLIFINKKLSRLLDVCNYKKEYSKS